MTDKKKHNPSPPIPLDKYKQDETSSRTHPKPCPVVIGMQVQPCHLLRDFFENHTIEEVHYAMHECLVGFIGSEYSQELTGQDRVHITITMQALAKVLKQFDSMFKDDNKQS
jgi:hypothetical protein